MVILNRINFPQFSIRLALFAGLIALLSVILHRFNLVGFQIALSGLTITVLSGLLAVLLGIVGLCIAIRRRDSILAALVGMLCGLIVTMPVVFTLLAASGLPRIHDISTDLNNPPQFKAILSLRDESDNALDRQIPKDLAQLQRAGYPDIEPLLLERPKAVVFNQALQLAKSRHWNIVAVSIDTGIIEATVVTPMMAFKDDVVIRIQHTGKMTQIDMRSVSRVGVSDLGANAKRIKNFLNALKSHN